MLHMLVQEPGQPIRHLLGIDEARSALALPGAVVWVDFDVRSPESDAVLEQVFGFHPLAIEDVYKEAHRPKVEDYDRYLYLIVLGLTDREPTRLDEPALVELDLFIGKNFVVTHHAGSLPAIAATREALLRGADFMRKGAVFVAHAILDRLVDQFLPLSARYEDELHRLEADVFTNHPDERHLGRILGLTQGLQHLRRITGALRDILAKLAAAQFDEVPDEARPFFRDVHEHMAQFVESTESQREELFWLFNTFQSLAAHRMNEVMKVLTLISTIMLPLTFIAGVYGMNFKHMPELEWHYGYYEVLSLMALVALALVYYFRRRRWL